MLAVGLTVGLVIGLLQALTQIQEQTVTFVPKIVAMFVALDGAALADYTDAAICQHPDFRHTGEAVRARMKDEG